MGNGGFGSGMLLVGEQIEQLINQVHCHVTVLGEVYNAVGDGGWRTAELTYLAKLCNVYYIHFNFFFLNKFVFLWI